MLITLFTKSRTDLAFYSKFHRLKANFFLIMFLWTPITLIFFIFNNIAVNKILGLALQHTFCY